MANLTVAEIEEVRHSVGKLLKSFHLSTAMGKEAWRAAITDLDAFLENQQATINNQFPEPFKSSATSKEKAMVVGYVALKRFDVL